MIKGSGFPSCDEVMRRGVCENLEGVLGSWLDSGSCPSQILSSLGGVN